LKNGALHERKWLALILKRKGFLGLQKGGEKRETNNTPVAEQTGKGERGFGEYSFIMGEKKGGEGREYFVTKKKWKREREQSKHVPQPAQRGKKGAKREAYWNICLDCGARKRGGGKKRKKSILEEGKRKEKGVVSSLHRKKGKANERTLLPRGGKYYGFFSNGSVGEKRRYVGSTVRGANWKKEERIRTCCGGEKNAGEIFFFERKGYRTGIPVHLLVARKKEGEIDE